MILGIDTSNYTTSLALLDDAGNLLQDERILLKVEKGNRGLRQSEAVSQHVENLPILFQRIFGYSPLAQNPFETPFTWTTEQKMAVQSACQQIHAIGVSTRPRSIEGSYMPCFVAGSLFAEMLSDALNCPLYRYSHQEGHMKAAVYNTPFENEKDFLAWHLSGGTCELLEWHWEQDSDQGKASEENLVGGTLDISFGQVLDRMGVSMNLPFPCGKAIDTLALESVTDSRNPLSKIRVSGAKFNLSGLETQIQRRIDCGDTSFLSYYVMSRITETIQEATLQACELTGLSNVLFAGGVSSSVFLRSHIGNSGRMKPVQIVFGTPNCSTDNAIGIARLAHQEAERIHT